MSWIKKCYNFFCSKFPIFQYLTGIHQKKKSKPILKELSCYINVPRENEVRILNYESLQKTLKEFARKEAKNSNVVHEFLNAKIKICQENYDYSKIEVVQPILVCLIKDDLLRLKEFLNYYRKIGIQYFVFLDNDSKDGTFDYLRKQKDVNLYQVKEQYTTQRREGWLNRLFQYIGYNKWILCVDSDELFTYIGMEQYGIVKYIEKIQERKVKRVRSIMIDMYSNKNIFEQSDEKDSMKDYCFFDPEGYTEEKNFRARLIYGGPRKRIFSTENKEFKCTLSKYPLFYYEKGDFQGCSHWQFPYYKNYDANVYGVLRHYKFMNGDLEKYKDRVMKGNYTSGSLEYKRYFEVLKENKKINFFYQESQQYVDSNSLNRIKIEDKKIINVFRSDGDTNNG